MDECCGTCKFSLVGTCRRHAPTIVRKPISHTYVDGKLVKEDVGDVTMWPQVGLHDWCGDYSTLDQSR